MMLPNTVVSRLSKRKTAAPASGARTAPAGQLLGLFGSTAWNTDLAAASISSATEVRPFIEGPIASACNTRGGNSGADGISAGGVGGYESAGPAASG